jgi:hypothetical protein
MCDRIGAPTAVTSSLFTVGMVQPGRFGALTLTTGPKGKSRYVGLPGRVHAECMPTAYRPHTDRIPTAG